MFLPYFSKKRKGYAPEGVWTVKKEKRVEMIRPVANNHTICCRTACCGEKFQL